MLYFQIAAHRRFFVTSLRMGRFILCVLQKVDCLPLLPLKFCTMRVCWSPTRLQGRGRRKHVLSTYTHHVVTCILIKCMRDQCTRLFPLCFHPRRPRVWGYTINSFGEPSSLLYRWRQEYLLYTLGDVHSDLTLQNTQITCTLIVLSHEPLTILVLSNCIQDMPAKLVKM